MFEPVIKLKILRWTDYPGLSGCVQRNHRGPYRRNIGKSEREGDVMTEEAIGVMQATAKKFQQSLEAGRSKGNGFFPKLPTGPADILTSVP